MGNSLRGLAALGCDDLLAILYGGDIYMHSTHRVSHTSGYVGGDVLTVLHRHAVTQWMGYLRWTFMDLSRMWWMRWMGFSIRHSFSFSLTRMMVWGPNNRFRRTNMSGSRSTLRNCNWYGSIYTCSDYLAVLTNQLLGVDSFCGDLLAGRGDHLLTMFMYNSIYYLIKLLVADLPRCLHLSGYTSGLGHTVTLWLCNSERLMSSQELGLSICISSSFSLDPSSDQANTEQAQGQEEVHCDPCRVNRTDIY